MGLWGEFGRRYGIRKPLADLVRDSEGTSLRRTLGVRDLTALGVGAIVGAGVFTVTGLVAADHAGPATAVSFLVAALVSAIAGLAYAELASTIPLGGSAYTYAYAGMGELVAWLVAWALVLSYGIGNAALASSFSDNLTGLALAAGFALPHAWTTATGGMDPATGARAVLDLPAVLIVALVTVLLLRPVKESATTNLVLVIVKVAVLLLFVVVGATRVDAANWTPFAPNGAMGIVSGAALIFFAFIGFDAVSTAAEETRDPQRDLPRGILLSLVVVTGLFVAVGLVLTGLVPSPTLGTGEPLAYALREVGLAPLGAVLNVGGLLASLSVLLVFQLATTRIFLAISRDGLFPEWIARVSAKHATPNRATLLLGAVVAFGAAVAPLGILVELTNAATLFFFGAVLVAVIALRRLEPAAKRPFRMPWSPWLPLAGLLTTTALFLGLSSLSLLGFAGWMGAGVMIYAAYGARRSALRRRLEAGGDARTLETVEARTPP